MARWFRRKDKKQQSLPEGQEVLREEVAAPEAGATPAGIKAAAGVPEAPPEDGSFASAAPSGFFHRLFQGEADSQLPASCGEAAVIQAAAQETPATEPGPEVEAVSEPAHAIEIAEAELPPELSQAPEAKKGLFRRFRERLDRTRDALAGGLDRLFAGRQVDAALLEELEELLITADLGVDTTLRLTRSLHDRVKRRELGDVERLKAALKAEMVAVLQAPQPAAPEGHPRVVLLVGVNGVGKTTTIAKLAHQDREQGLRPLLVAADTFRAAAAEQLEIWGERVGAPVVRQKAGADPAAVVFDGLAAALARDVDTVYIDTAGRLHTKVNLMEELKKIHRTAAKKLPGAPHEVWLILDATTGQNALSQARLFQEAVGVTGLILTKLDGTAKGGIALAVVHETGLPIRYLGVGEGMDDLRPFDPEAFVTAILG